MSYVRQFVTLYKSLQAKSELIVFFVDTIILERSSIVAPMIDESDQWNQWDEELMQPGLS